VDLFDAPYFAAHEPDFDAVRMRGTFGEDVSDDAIREATGVLVLFQDDGDAETVADVLSLCRVGHNVLPINSSNINIDGNFSPTIPKL